MLLPECPPVFWNFPNNFFLKPSSAFWQLLKRQSWGKDELQYWCWIQWALRSPTLSEGWLSDWINLPAPLSGVKLKISLPMEQGGDVCIVPLSAGSHKLLLFAAFLLMLFLSGCVISSGTVMQMHCRSQGFTWNNPQRTSSSNTKEFFLLLLWNRMPSF